jgi:crotonobetainyl-CoA:carnitine CoA-transferase CaiB-like acyl-CoA transferase
MVNHSKTNRVIDIDSQMEDLEGIVSRSDVIIENVGEGRARALGVSAYSVFPGERPNLVVSFSGFGYDGPYSKYRTYAYNLQTSCGLMYLTRNDAGVPCEVDVDMPWADLICGYAVATIVAAWAVGPAGNESQGIDFSMAELVCARFNEFLAAASVDQNSDDLVDRANDISPFAPNGVYRTEDGWVALSVTSDASFDALCQMLGHPQALSNGRFRTARERFEFRDELDTAVAEVVAVKKTKELADSLHLDGVLCEEVLSPVQLPSYPHLQDRQFFAPFNHPDWSGQRLTGIPWRIEGNPPIALTAPPSLEDGVQLPGG